MANSLSLFSSGNSHTIVMMYILFVICDTMVVSLQLNIMIMIRKEIIAIAILVAILLLIKYI